MMIKLLLVEDDTSLAYIEKSTLEDIIGGYEVVTAENGKEGLQKWEEFKPDVIISDIDMPEMAIVIKMAEAATTDPRPSTRNGTIKILAVNTNIMMPIARSVRPERIKVNGRKSKIALVINAAEMIYSCGRLL